MCGEVMIHMEFLKCYKYILQLLKFMLSKDNSGNLRELIVRGLFTLQRVAIPLEIPRGLWIMELRWILLEKTLIRLFLCLSLLILSCGEVICSLCILKQRQLKVRFHLRIRRYQRESKFEISGIHFEKLCNHEFL